jgi:hypothetical protein
LPTRAAGGKTCDDITRCSRGDESETTKFG